MIDASAPFLLFDDAREGGTGEARLYGNPREIIEARDAEGVRRALERLEAVRNGDLHVAGFFSYEAGHALERKLEPLQQPLGPDAPPLLWFALFDAPSILISNELEGWLPDACGAWAGAPAPLIEQEDYVAAVRRIKAHIEAGDIYQANLTFQAEVRTLGHPLALYASIRQRARAGHGGVVFTGEHWLLSFSPELFFTLEAGRITTRPMKGTAKRQGAGDGEAIEQLRNDPKQRAENLMIVDLLRNDLSKVSKAGTVKVPSLFEIETYPTVHQMTSTVTAELKKGVGAADVIRAIFPCGSITGAPKIRAMEIIAETETLPRNVYTGSIGWVDGQGNASFNVAIRTLTLKAGEHRARMGLGSGIVADSVPEEEWRECLAKGAFVKSDAAFSLIETMRFDPREGLLELEAHLARMKASAAEFGFPFNRHAARNDLQAATFRLREPRKIRLVVSSSGAVAIEGRPLPEAPAEPVHVAVAPLPVSADDFRLRHKTSNRSFYDEARAGSGAFEILFHHEGNLTEGSFTHVFVKRDGVLLTPPLSRGLLPGVLRQRLIDAGEAKEADLTLADLADGFFIGNSVRGLIEARLERSDDDIETDADGRGRSRRARVFRPPFRRTKLRGA